MRLLTAVTILCALGLLACSTTKESKSKKSRYSRDYIYSEEIQTSTATNAYHLIKNLRPHWLWGRGTKSIRYEEASYPVIYVNESRHGDIDSLSTIPITNIKEIQFLNSGDATNRFGIDHASGAILITLL
ncbi:MAG: hypothetical protein ACE5IW_11510 [bacterium]